MKQIKKKEYFTFMFLPGPYEHVRTLSISKGVIKSVFLSLAAILTLSLYMVYEYNEMKNKIYEMKAIEKVSGSSSEPTPNDILAYWTAISDAVNFRPVLIFLGFMLLMALIFYTSVKVVRMMSDSRASAVKNKLIEDFRSALDESCINPRQGSGYARKQ